MKNKEFEKYFNKYYSQAIGYTEKKVNDIYIAEDIVMNSFYSCYLKYETFDSEKASFSTWFYFVLNNKIKNYYRDHKNHDNIDNVTIIEDSFENEIMAAVELSRARDTLKLALENLNEVQRKIIVLKFFENKNAVEISKILGISHGNVRIQITRCIDKIRACFKNPGIEWEV